jgi:ATP-dependent RNA circularization protein (DNA/RNA ligase family)
MAITKEFVKDLITLQSDGNIIPMLEKIGKLTEEEKAEVRLLLDTDEKEAFMESVQNYFKRLKADHSIKKLQGK